MIFRSRFMPCPDCGASVDWAELRTHECSVRRRADFQLFELRDEVEQLETEIGRYLASASGRFESWLAARQVRGPA